MSLIQINSLTQSRDDLARVVDEQHLNSVLTADFSGFISKPKDKVSVQEHCLTAES